VPAWTSILDRIGSPYDVIYADRDPLRRRLLETDGIGRYSAVLLTSAALLHKNRQGRFVSALDPPAWSLLRDYERSFGVRRVALNAAPGAEPEDHGLRLVAEGPSGEVPLPVELTPLGAEIFDYLRPDTSLPLAEAYVYRCRLAAGARARPLLTLDGDVVAAVTTTPDDRESLHVCFTLGETQPIEEMLGFGLLRWATRGVFLGEHRHWLNVDVDDWCDLDGLKAEEWPPDPLPTDGASSEALARAQERLRAAYPLAAALTLNLAYNGGGAAALGSHLPAQDPPIEPREVPGPAGPPPTAAFRWVNHTFSHPSLETASYQQSRDEIMGNLEAARVRGLPVDPAVLKTPGYSGLGVLGAGDGDDGALLDRGLEASNVQLLEAARDAGIRFVHGNMSFPSHQPDCFNGGTVHPLQPDIVVVPDWPTAFPWWAGRPDEVLEGYSTPVGAGGGRHAAVSYSTVVEVEAELAFRHVISGSVYSHTLHRANTFEYLPGRSIAVDWLERVLEKYSALYRVPLQSPDWRALADHVVARSAHARALARGAEVTWDRSSGCVRCTSVTASTLFLVGAGLGETSPGQGLSLPRVHAERYAGDELVRLDMAESDELVLQARPRD
jgi:hypothetical protein